MGNAVGFGNVESLGNVAVERENFCQRMGNSLCGVCFGILLFLGSIFLLGWNEFNYVRNQAILLKVDKEVIEAGCVPSASNVGKPIWASCVVQRGYDFTTDPQVQSMGLSFSGEVRGAWFKADSTILQWTEDKSCSSHQLPEEWLADSELWNHSNFASTDLERSRWHSGNGFIHRLPLLSGQQGDGCLSIGASDRSFRPEDQFAAQQAAGAGGRHFGAVQFGPRTELHWRRPDHLHPVPGPVWPDAGSHHRQAGCHVKQQCSDETLGHPVAWYHVLGRLGLNGWLIQIGHDQREAK